jgi:hypothetical protein
MLTRRLGRSDSASGNSKIRVAALATCGLRERNNGQQKAKQTAASINYMNIIRSQHTASSTPSGKKSARTKTSSSSTGNAAPAKSKPQKKVITQPSSEQVALRAYYIGERRRSLGIHGDETSDWVAAERELLAETKRK